MNKKTTAIIASVGRQTEPILKSLEVNKPDHIVFLCSQGTLEFAVSVKQQHLEKGHSPTSVNYVIIEGQNGHESLNACYESSLKCAALLKEVAPDTEQVLVDYTTGTRSMSAALVIMSIKENFDLIYVGGDVRDKDGLGIVKSGSEKIHQFQNPWKRLAYLQKQRLVALFNQYQYQACLASLENILKEDALDPQEKALMMLFQHICSGYAAWDRFEHGSALSELLKAQEKIKTSFVADSRLSSLSDALTQHIELLKTLRVLQKKKAEQPDQLRADDLFANAQRRYNEHKYDDTVARLYRLIEMLGQIDLYDDTEQLTHKYPKSMLPEHLSSDYIHRCTDKEKPEFVRLGLKDTYQLLDALNRPIGKLFEELKDDYNSLMSARNQSILAHGNIPLGKEKADKAFAFVKKIYTPTNQIEFPTLKEL